MIEPIFIKDLHILVTIHLMLAKDVETLVRRECLAPIGAVITLQPNQARQLLAVGVDGVSLRLAVAVGVSQEKDFPA